jgi:hypothetical protein
MVKNKKAVSAMVGYVLLITFGIVMGVIVYNYLKTYVPKDPLDCPAGVAISLQDYSCSAGELNITLKNNGKFNFAGFFIHASNNTNQKIATIDLSQYLLEGPDKGKKYQNSVVLNIGSENTINPGRQTTFTFKDIPNNIELIEIIPARFQEQDETLRFVSCSSAKISEKIVCN